MTLPPSQAAPQPSPPPPAPPLFASITHEEVTAGRLISRTLEVWWRNVLKFAGLGVLAFVPVVGLGVAAAVVIPLTVTRGAPPGPAFSVVMAFVPVVLMALTMLVLTGGVTYGAVQHLASRPVRFGAMVGVGFRRALPVLAAGVLCYVLVLVGLVLLVVPGLVLACALAAVIPAVVIERAGPIGAIKRSWALTRGHRLTLFAAWLLLYLVLFGANVLLQAGMLLLGPLAAILLVPILLVMSLPALLPAVAYHDLRVAKEGSATEDLARVFE